jgi:hypothetical protein
MSHPKKKEKLTNKEDDAKKEIVRDAIVPVENPTDPPKEGETKEESSTGIIRPFKKKKQSF